MIKHCMGMQKIVMITENVDKTNIILYSVLVLPFESIETSFSKMIQTASRKDEKAITITYCQTQNKCVHLYL